MNYAQASIKCKLALGANLHLIQKALEKPLIYWAFSIKKLSEVLLKRKKRICILI